MSSVLLDTSFLIRLLKKDDELHNNAYQYIITLINITGISLKKDSF